MSEHCSQTYQAKLKRLCIDGHAEDSHHPGAERRLSDEHFNTVIPISSPPQTRPVIGPFLTHHPSLVNLKTASILMPQRIYHNYTPSISDRPSLNIKSSPFQTPPKL